MTELQGKLQDIFARTPLLISFPTIILSSNYIIQNTNNPDIWFNWSSIFINIFLLPFCLSSCISVILHQFNILRKIRDSTDSHSIIIPVFIFTVVLFQSNWLLKPVFTGCVVLVTLRQLQNEKCHNYKKNTLLKDFIKCILPLIIILFIVNYYYNYDDDLNDSKYRLVASSINILSVIRIRYNQNVIHVVRSKLNFSLKFTQIIETFILYVIPVLSFLLLLLVQNMFDKNINIQYLMIGIFLGCTVLMTLSFNDIISNNIGGNTDSDIIDNSKNGMNHKLLLEINKNVILIIGLMSIFLQYLSFDSHHSHFSFNKNNSANQKNTNKSLYLNMLNILFVIFSEYLSRFQSGQVTNSSNVKADSYNVVNEKDIRVSNGNNSNNDSNKGKPSILLTIVTSKDTRSIFSFLLLNATFMLVQLLYSFRSRSLGLLSDSLHMALDCTSLLLGLVARILSTTSVYYNPDKFPFNLNYLESLAGFTNGILLIGIVCGIFVQAFERLMNPIHLHGTNELIAVSILGLMVNLVGLFVFETGHSTNNDSHGNSHGYGHSHSHTSLNNNDGYSHSNYDENFEINDTSSDNNMKGIFLHILADTLGSVGVVISTLLIKLTGWHIFDPIASVMIATLILFSSIPLLKLTTNTLLLKLDTKKHNMVRQALNQIIQTPGITGYTTPKFWPYTPDKINHGHSHSHEHSCVADEKGDTDVHYHTHSHSHKHNHKHEVYSNKNKKTPILTGYIHIQYVDGENSTIIKKRVEKICENIGIKAWIQTEPASGTCWCRQASMANQPISQPIIK